MLFWDLNSLLITLSCEFRCHRAGSQLKAGIQCGCDCDCVCYMLRLILHIAIGNDPVVILSPH